ncbi:MAG: microtubule-binding protein [Thermofilaceae archaeon]
MYVEQKLLEEIRRVVKEAVEESKREDVLKLAAAIEKITQVLEKMLERLERVESDIATVKADVAVLKSDMAALKSDFSGLKSDVSSLKADVTLLKANVAGFTGRMGLDLERAVLAIYRDLLGIDPVKVEKVSFIDDGTYYRKGAKLELDVYVHDGVVYFIEVKAVAEAGDVEWFEERCRIFERYLRRTPQRKILVAINAFKDAVERARELGIDVIVGRVLEEA